MAAGGNDDEGRKLALSLRGPPHALEGVAVGLPLGTGELRMKELAKPVQVFITELNSRVRGLRSSLPVDFPAAEYEGELNIADRAYRVTVRVDPRMSYRLFPSLLYFRAGPDQLIEDEITLLNVGNVPIALRARCGLGLYDNDGVESAAYKAFSQSMKPDVARSEALFEGLARGHGGLAAVELIGADVVAPGEMLAVRLRARLPDRIQYGHNYFGSVALARGVQLAVEVETPDPPAPV